VENKCKFFSWLLQNRLWTADMITRHGGQANTICHLCRAHPESAIHIMAQCPFTQLWIQVASWMGIHIQPPPQTNYRKLETWWNDMAHIWRNDAKEIEQQFIYTIWNIWKERCRRVYDNKAMIGSQLLHTIKLDVD
jgi:hypothetical protein